MNHSSRAENLLVLIIDDMPENVEVLGETLGNDYIVQFATSGPEGLDLVQRRLPDLILLDVMMPGMNGFEVLAALGRDPRTRTVPVIFVTARSDAESETQALASGAVDFIHKPINPHVVRTRVNTHIALKQREAKLKALNAALETRVEERTQALREALVRAEAASLAKSAFLNNMSHEIRTPMNAIMGLSGLMLQKAQDPDSQRRLRSIQAASQQLLNLLSGILDLARIQANRLKIARLDFQLGAVVNQVFESLRQRAEAKGLSLAWESDPALPRTLRGDPLRLGQILANYLDNAIKFSTDAGGRVLCRAQWLHAAATPPRLRLEVLDQGIGIDQAALPGLFKVFEQIDGSATRGQGGTGLGLALNKHLAETMGGEVGVASVPGQGSAFWATVPLVAGHDNAVKEEAAEDAWTFQALESAWYLKALLEELDAAAINFWKESDRALSPVLGASKHAFGTALESFDFELALAILSRSIEAYAQRAGPQPRFSKTDG
jgi:signal transduction histidine kinase